MNEINITIYLDNKAVHNLPNDKELAQLKAETLRYLQLYFTGTYWKVK